MSPLRYAWPTDSRNDAQYFHVTSVTVGRDDRSMILVLGVDDPNSADAECHTVFGIQIPSGNVGETTTLPIHSAVAAPAFQQAAKTRDESTSSEPERDGDRHVVRNDLMRVAHQEDPELCPDNQFWGVAWP